LLLGSDQGRKGQREERGNRSSEVLLHRPISPTGTTKKHHHLKLLTTPPCSSEDRCSHRRGVDPSSFCGGLRGRASHRLGGGVEEGNRRQPTIMTCKHYDMLKGHPGSSKSTSRHGSRPSENRKSKRADDLRSPKFHLRSIVATHDHRGLGLLNVKPERYIREKRHADAAIVNDSCTSNLTLLLFGETSDLGTGWILPTRTPGLCTEANIQMIAHSL